ncbi:hypothetical protein [Halorubrum vacuolatum]|uniref:hypothetical protein n=1 Tax=Halorubrum vacuolatum TaxID=63740 RepID=UPI00117AD771|nr:hypothetical protein [Halorubrum vacuolatum]
MRIDWHSEARQDLQKFDKQIQKKIVLEKVDSMAESPLGENTSIIVEARPRDIPIETERY